MSVLKKIIGQSLIFFVGSVVSVIIGFFFKIYLSRHLGAEGLGLYTLGVSILGILGIFLSLGYGNGLVKFVSKYITEQKNRRLYSYLNNTLIINVLISSFLGCIFFFFSSTYLRKSFFQQSFDSICSIFWWSSVY